MILNPYRYSAAGVAFDGFGNASRSFDGVNDFIDISDSDDHSFGDSVNDSPFSVCAWVKMVDATHFWIATKHNNSTQAEWIFAIGGDDKLYFAAYDGSQTTYRGLTSVSTLTSYEGQWIHLAATYDGSGGTSAQDGMTTYLTTFGGSTSAISSVDFTAGTYTAMHNGTQDLEIGSWTSNSRYANGNIADVRIYDKELSSAEVQSLADGTDVQDSLIGWWLDDDNDVLDNAGTNDGTNNGSTYSTDGPAD